MRYLIIIPAIVLCCVITLAQETNVVPNAGFEKVEGGAPVGWALTGAADLDNAQFYAGAMGLRMVHPEATTSAATVQVRCPQRTCLAALWVRTEGVRGAGAMLRVLGPDGRVIAATEPVTGESAWRLVQVEFNPGNTNPVTV